MKVDCICKLQAASVRCKLRARCKLRGASCSKFQSLQVKSRCRLQVPRRCCQAVMSSRNSSWSSGFDVGSPAQHNVEAPRKQSRWAEMAQECAKGRKGGRGVISSLSLPHATSLCRYRFHFVRVAARSASWRVAVQMHTYSGSDRDKNPPKLSTPPRIALCVSGQCTWSREGHYGASARAGPHERSRSCVPSWSALQDKNEITHPSFPLVR